MTNLEKAYQYFVMKDICVTIDYNTLYILVEDLGGHELQLSQSEIDYRAELYDEQFKDKKPKYPFREGDTYYTLEVVKSCWDEVSEDMHDSNPNQLYFKTRAEAESKINK